MVQSDWIIVTGGTSPLGSVLCQALATAGYNIIIHYHQQRAHALEIVKTCQELGVDACEYQGDFSSQERVAKFLASCSHIRIKHLINNASYYAVANLIDTPLHIWQHLWQINLTAILQLIQGLTPILAEQRGSIINMGVAGLGRSAANTYNPAYTMTKAALLQMTRCLAPQLMEQHLRINMLSPGHLPHSYDLALFADSSPTKQPVPLQAIVDSALFLLSDRAASITGQNIEVAAGALI
jgi:NAD(P)-dependent dehydrogenase (short-subunit alcohol dehydrogenase family)